MGKAVFFRSHFHNLLEYPEKYFNAIKYKEAVKKAGDFLKKVVFPSELLESMIVEYTDNKDIYSAEDRAFADTLTLDQLTCLAAGDPHHCTVFRCMREKKQNDISKQKGGAA